MQKRKIQLLFYVGNEGKKSGENTSLQLVATQQHAESSNLSKVVTTLKTGRNEVIIPKLTSTDVERGGALYVQYTGNNPKGKISAACNGWYRNSSIEFIWNYG